MRQLICFLTSRCFINEFHFDCIEISLHWSRRVTCHEMLVVLVDDRFKHWRLKTLAWHVGMASWLCFQFPSLNNCSWGKKKFESMSWEARILTINSQPKGAAFSPWIWCHLPLANVICQGALRYWAEKALTQRYMLDEEGEKDDVCPVRPDVLSWALPKTASLSEAKWNQMK